jgi:alpha-L-fucosidase
MCVQIPICRAATDEPETKEQRDARMQWWREARFGMFIHWGVYSVPAGTYHGQQSQHIGEWIMHDFRIPCEEYQSYTKEFNPTKFDADAWVKLAKNAGMKYIVITSKHHDGFAMFHSTTSPLNIYDATPFKRDPLKELAEACKNNGMKLGFYYSQCQDWNHPGGAAAGQKDKSPVLDDDNHWDKAQQGSFDDYLKTIAVPQVKEILTNYGDVAVLWWDTPMKVMTKERAELFLPVLKLQPNIITNNRLVSNCPEIQGDTETPEQYIPATGMPGRDFEVCMTMNSTWGYKSFDNNWKSTETILKNLIDIASKGGNYLLNVGPTSEGVIPEPSQERLNQIGEWMKVNSDAIYGTSASPFRKYTFDGRVTMKGNMMFLHVFSWPSEGIKVAGVKSPVVSAKVLGGETVNVKTDKDENGSPVLTIATPQKTDPIATVIALQFESAPEIDLGATAVHADSDGNLKFNASDAVVNGRKAKLTGDYVSSWSDTRDSVLWDFVPAHPGQYKVELTYACPESSAGSEMAINVGDSKSSAKVESTGGEDSWKSMDGGTVDVGQGIQTLMIRPTKIAKESVMNLKSVKLTPIH